MSDNPDWGLDDSSLTEPGIKADARQAEQTVKVGSDAVKSLFDPETGLTSPANKNRFRLWVAVGVFLVGSLVFVFFAGAPKPPAGGSGSTDRVHRQVDGSSQDSEMVQRSIVEYNENVLPEIQKNENPYAHPLLVKETQEAEVINPFAESAAVPAEPVRKVAQEEPAPEQPKPRRALNELQMQLAEEMMTDLMAQEAKTPALLTASWNYSAPRRAAAANNQAAASGGEQGDDSEPSMRCEYKSVRAGDELFGTANLAMNSDVGGEVSFTIRSGPLNGYKALGTFERREKWLRIMLNRIVAKDAVVPINAIALDMETSLNAVQGKVNRHLMYRYGWWGFGTILSAVGRAAEMGADKEVYTSDGVVVENVKTTTNKEILIALGGLGSDLGAQAQERLNRPITVSLKRGEQVGIYPLDDICVK